MTDTQDPNPPAETPSPSSDDNFDFGTVIDDAKKVVTNPVEFYRNMPTEGGYANPLIFAVVMAVITGVVMAVLSLFGLGRAAGVGGIGLGAVVIMPIMALIASFVGGAILFVIWKLMGSEKSYEAAVRCTCYSLAIMPITAVLSVLPYLGGIIQTLWSMFIGYIASIEVGKVKESTAKIVFGVLAAILTISGINAERFERKLHAKVDKLERGAESFTKSLEQSDTALAETFRKIEQGEEVSAEEAGRAAGEFIKNLEAFGKGLEEATKAEESTGGEN